MKRIICFILAFVFVFTLAACGAKKAAAPEKKVVEAPKYDLDMSGMNYTMAYSQLSNIMSNPSEYEGKTIKMKGTFDMIKGATQTYYICTIADSTACCSAGMEFVLKNEPDDYPPLATEITVAGEFETYLEDGKTYCHLKNADLL